MASETQSDYRVGISHPMPFSAALWKYVSHQTGMEESYLQKDGSKGKVEAPKRRIDKGPVGRLPDAPVEKKEVLRKEILTMSLNPSIYGNKYNVLGSS